MIHGVIFDLGSTLIHRTGLDLEREKCAALASWAAEACGCRDPEDLAARLLRIRLAAWKRAEEEQVEQLATGSIAEALQGAGIAAEEDLLRRAEAVFFEPEVRVSRLYPGAAEMLESLRAMDLRLGLISNATSHRLILDVARRHGLDRRLDPIVSSAGFGRTKPHPAIFTHVLEAWRVPPGEAVMVGDTLGADILGAEQAGLRSILVDIEPNPDNPRFAGRCRPTARVTSLPEISEIVRGWRGGLS